MNLLEARNIGKRFPGVVALDDVSFTVRAGEIHALMGENGAGKSTLIKVLTGVTTKDDGVIKLDDRIVQPASPKDADSLGIRTVYQEMNLVPYMSVAENMLIGRLPTFAGFLRPGKMRSMAREALMRLGVDIDVSRPTNTYSIAVQQMIAIARAVMPDPRRIGTKVLVLDEPTSSLDAAEVEQLFQVMQQLRSEGVGIVFVTHFMDQVYRVSDRITVLRNGRFVGEYLAKDLPRIELVARMMGKDPAEVSTLWTHRPESAAAEAKSDADAIRINGLGRSGKISPVTFKIGPGEAVGLAGLLGSGRTEIARLIFGVDHADSGSLDISGKSLRPRSPRRMIAQGLAMTPEDRKADGIVPNLSVRENIILALQSKQGLFKRISSQTQRQIADQFIARLGIRTPHAEQAIRNLSGGNQQKVLLARWLVTRPRLLILDEPTRGIDVGAKAEIEQLIGELCQENMSVLFISSELEEVARTCQRVVVLRDRKQVGTLEAGSIDVATIVQTIARHQSDAAEGAAV